MNAGLKKYQEEKRQETIDKLKGAVDSIRAENDIPTKKEVLLRSGLSDSVLKKKKVRDWLYSYTPELIKKTVPTEMQDGVSRLEYNDLLQKYQKIQSQLNKTNDQSKKYEYENKQLNRELSILRGYVHKLESYIALDSGNEFQKLMSNYKKQVGLQ